MNEGVEHTHNSKEYIYIYSLKLTWHLKIMLLNRNLLFQGSPIFRCELLVSGEKDLCLFGLYKQTANFCTPNFAQIPVDPLRKGGLEGQSTWIPVNSNEEGSFRSKARMAGLRERGGLWKGGKTTKPPTEMAVKCFGEKKQTKENMAIAG